MLRSLRFSHLIRNIAWLGLASAAVKPIWFAFITVVCARGLGTEGYGAFTTALSLTALTFSLTGFGITPFTVREVARDRECASMFFSNFIVVRLGLFVVASMLAVGVGGALGYGSALIATVLAACLYQSALILTEYARCFFQAFAVLKYQAVSVVAEKALVIAGGMVLLAATTSPAWTVSGMAAGMLLTAVGTVLWVARRLAPFRPTALDRSFILGALRTMAPMGVAAVLSMAFFRTDTVMVESLLGTVEAGQYGLAFRIVEALNMLPFILVDAAAYPQLARLAREGDFGTLRRLIWVVLLGLTAISVALALGITLGAQSLIRWISGDALFMPAAPALALLGWAFPLTSIRVLFYALLLALDEQRFAAWALGFGVLLNVALNFALIPVMGIQGAVATTLCSEAALLAAYAWHGLRRLRHVERIATPQ